LNAIGESLIFSFEIAEIKLEKKGRVFQSARYHLNILCVKNEEEIATFTK
jgi:hypothetical protein